MNLFRHIKENEDVPQWYGVAWRNPWKRESVCLPIGLNAIARFIRDLYFRVAFPESLWRDSFADLKAHALEAEARATLHEQNASCLRSQLAERDTRILNLSLSLDQATSSRGVFAARIRRLNERHERLIEDQKDLTWRHEMLIEVSKEVSAAYELLKAERDRVASGKASCGDCNSILARW